MKPIAEEAHSDEAMQDALLRAQAFLAVVLAERTGSLTNLQRDMLHSAMVAIVRADKLMAELLAAMGPPL